ncbi:4'-phosphopantetheinyl transferase superfamily protein [Mycoplasmopsis alligatoris]|uniref:Phosphopantethiene--protein transferase domain protein n=1 Tax=Mycoplasmopsis alligatoris A21JP2 TaxID=747682 RepID=D4XV66_9BACT|nr:4'-phosphopantetheinyl transferase superfamily protein [Mycoplasmopsis alligatoris]EFF41761.1 phosphopantethiene--protein transferase domain protein [Mycoplasmopsis alligatoris A21JP2]
MLGVDLVKISRFNNKSLEFAQKILSKNELEEFLALDKDQKALFLARSWAIKEAIFKADNTKNKFSKIDLCKINNKWTYKNFNISISHEDDLLIAIAMKEVLNECKN